MVGEAAVSRLVASIREQAEAGGLLGSPLYAELLTVLAADVLAGGPGAAVLAGHEDAPQDAAAALQLMGGVHRLVLERRAPTLALYYPSVGGTANAAAAWPAFREGAFCRADRGSPARGGVKLPSRTCSSRRTPQPSASPTSSSASGRGPAATNACLRTVIRTASRSPGDEEGLITSSAGNGPARRRGQRPREQERSRHVST